MFFNFLQRFFGLVRAGVGGHSKLTASTFLQLFRMLSMYYPIKAILRGSNADEGDNCRILPSYVSILKQKFKEKSRAKESVKVLTKDILLSNMKVELKKENVGEAKRSNRNENVVYYVTGYVISKFLKGNKFFPLYALSIQTAVDDLPENFTSVEFTSLKSKGKLKFASSHLFALMKKVELLISDFCSRGQINHSFAFQDILYSLREDELP